MDILEIKAITSAQWLILILLFSLIFLTSQWIHYQMKNRTLVKLANKLPTPLPYKFILGSWYRLDSKILLPLCNAEDFTKLIMTGMRISAEKPYSLFCMWVGPVPEIFVQNPQDVQVILTSSRALEKGPEYNFSKFGLGEGLITAPGPKWKISRRYMNPVFHQRNLNHLTSVFNQTSRQLVEDMADYVGGEPFDAFKQLFNASITSVCSILFGVESQSRMKNHDFHFGASIALRISTWTAKRCFSPWLWSDRAFYFFYRKELDEFENNWIQFTRQPMKVIGNSEFQTIPKAYRNILQDYSTFSDADMNFEMKTILIAGSDTTALGVCACLVLLGTHPDIQEKLYNEIMDLLGSEDRDITTNDLNSLPYLDQVIKECLRISTIIIAFKRTCTEEIKLSEYTIPKGGDVVISIIGLHFDPEVYPDPYVFDPDRFTPENVAKRHPYSFLPFGGGPRNCIGKQYAMMSMKIMLAHLLRAYKISASKDLLDSRFAFVVTLRAIDGYQISLESRI